MSGLFTDLYELTMSASALEHGLDDTAIFELFVRALPPERRYLVACGIDEALAGLERFALDEEEIRYLKSLGNLGDELAERLRRGFTGEVWTVAEGEVIFAAEPIVQVIAPFVEAQLVETFLLNAIGFPTLVASKASRLTTACAGRAFVEFGARRAQSIDAAEKAARAAYVGGAAATSLVSAGKRYLIPLTGTMAHSFVMSFERELDAFRAFCATFPNGDAVLLLDTYDTVAAAHKVVALHGEGHRFRGVRLDSGDLVALARQVRAILDAGGLTDVAIFASGDLDEYRIAALVEAGAPIDAFGVGTQLSTSADAPALGCVYKLVGDRHGPKRKVAPGKATLPGRKQVYRAFTPSGSADHDVIALATEAPPPDAQPLLAPQMIGGRRVSDPETLDALRERCRRGVASLPPPARRIAARVEGETPDYEVRVSPALARLASELDHRQR